MCERDEAGMVCPARWDQGTADTLYSIISLAQLSCVKDEIYIRGMEDVTEISSPSLVIRTQTQTLSFIQFTCEKSEIESADPPTDKIQAIRLGWMARERREANILQYLWKYFTKNIEAWAPHGKVKGEDRKFTHGLFKTLHYIWEKWWHYIK